MATTAELTINIAALFDVPWQMLGEVRDNPVPIGNWNFDAPPGGAVMHYFTASPPVVASEQAARADLRDIMQRYRGSAQVLKSVIEEGRINGATFGDFEMADSPCCIIGWLERRDVYPLGVGRSRYQALQSFVRYVRPRETHQTPDSPLATLYAEIVTFLDEQHVVSEALEEDEDGLSATEMVAQVERLLADSTRTTVAANPWIGLDRLVSSSYNTSSWMRGCLVEWRWIDEVPLQRELVSV